ncbi:MAG: TerC family protein [Cytophagales bacterium]|nr:MAG: TerC family protein [Cytophagales bacterium]TAF61970.1 MAG: TerC family protein [Cytophagales bacterium]
MQIFTAEGLIALLTLTLLEIVLGIDNVIFISIISDKLKQESEKAKARNLGIMLALAARIGLLFGISWIVSLKEPLITVLEQSFSGRDIILLLGGLFLMGKSTSEIHAKMEMEEEGYNTSKKQPSLMSAIIQIVFIDIVFSFDSILTAVGLVKEISIMITAVIISMAVMFIFAKNISDFINEHPTFKMLALSFLIMIGFLLVAESLGVHVPKAYIYFAMGFAFIVEVLNMRMRKKAKLKAKQEAHR